MIIERIKLVNFRNYLNDEFKFDKGINFIYGDNAIGKTNLVEGIYYFSLSRSFRTRNDNDLINKNACNFYLEGDFKKNNVSYVTKLVFEKNVKKISINSKNIKKISELSNIVNVLSFIPADVDLLKNSPKNRREFLNSAIAKSNKIYIKLLLDFELLLKERNNLLKQDELDFNLISVVTRKLANISFEIYKIRKSFIKELEIEVCNVYKNIFLKEIQTNIEYLTFNKKENYISEFIKIFEENLENDLKNNFTTQGIQKDDFSLKIDGKEIGKYGSQGENRIAALSLKLAIYNLSNEDNKPILILDDILSELDSNNEKLLLNYLNNVEQVFITSTKKYEINNCNYCYLSK